MAVSKLVSEPRFFPKSGFDVIGSSYLFEEETLPGYRASSYYPVNIGEVFAGRYQAVVKLGFGSSSTVWLCRDLR
jgi:serine/threonine-protein kinase SRPK3